MGMISPICELTIGDMYRVAGYLSGLTYTIMDEGTWELDLNETSKVRIVTMRHLFTLEKDCKFNTKTL